MASMTSHFYLRNNPEAAKKNLANFHGHLKKSNKKMYAYYINDELVAKGNMDSLIKQTGLKRSTLFYYASPDARNTAKSARYRYVVRLN